MDTPKISDGELRGEGNCSLETKERLVKIVTPVHKNEGILLVLGRSEKYTIGHTSTLLPLMNDKKGLGIEDETTLGKS